MAGLLAKLDAASHDADKALEQESHVDPRELHRMLLSTLRAHGMTKTAASLQEEAKMMRQDIEAAAAPASPAIPTVHAQLPGKKHGRAEYELQDALKGGKEAKERGVKMRQELANTAKTVADQKVQLASIVEQIRQLKEARMSEAQGQEMQLIADQVAQQQVSQRRIEEVRHRTEQFRLTDGSLKATLGAKEEEIGKLKALIERKRQGERDAQRRLLEVRENLASARAAPVQVSQLEEDIVQSPPASPAAGPAVTIGFKTLTGAEAEETFRYRPLGFHVGGTNHTHPHVDGVRQGGQAAALGLEDGWRFWHIDGTDVSDYNFKQFDVFIRERVAHLPDQKSMPETLGVHEHGPSSSSKVNSATNHGSKRAPMGPVTRSKPHSMSTSSLNRRPKSPRETPRTQKQRGSPESLSSPDPSGSTQREKLLRALGRWEDVDGLRFTAAPALFEQCDGSGVQALRWSEEEVRRFAGMLFEHVGAHVPEWLDRVWYELFRQTGKNADSVVDIDHCMDYTRQCFEAAVQTYDMLPSSGATSPLGSGYQSTEVAATIQTVLAAALQKNNTGALSKATSNVFKQLDRNTDGRIDWNSGEIKGFVLAIFKRYSVPLPSWPDQGWFEKYHECSVHRRHAISLEEAIKFARICFEATLAEQLL